MESDHCKRMNNGQGILYIMYLSSFELSVCRHAIFQLILCGDLFLHQFWVEKMSNADFYIHHNVLCICSHDILHKNVNRQQCCHAIFFHVQYIRYYDVVPLMFNPLYTDFNCANVSFSFQNFAIFIMYVSLFFKSVFFPLAKWF